MTHELFTFSEQMLYSHKMKHIAVASNATWSDKSRSVLFMFLSEQFNSRSSSKISMNSAVHLHISLRSHPWHVSTKSSQR
jgi:hypothetical protein